MSVVAPVHCFLRRVRCFLSIIVAVVILFIHIRGLAVWFLVPVEAILRERIPIKLFAELFDGRIGMLAFAFSLWPELPFATSPKERFA